MRTRPFHNRSNCQCLTHRSARPAPKRGRDRVAEAQPTHALNSLVHIGRESIWRPVIAGREQPAQEPLAQEKLVLLAGGRKEDKGVADAGCQAMSARPI